VPSGLGLGVRLRRIRLLLGMIRCKVVGPYVDLEGVFPERGGELAGVKRN
jgi:hypothetical protein